MIKRRLNITHGQSFFLFGARATGKTTFLRDQFSPKNPLWIDLLNTEDEDRYSRDPMLLEREVYSLVAQNRRPDWIVIDEVQKAPRLLNVVHRLIENKKLTFALTGSSARKLKRGGADMLGGRALVHVINPFAAQELSSDFALSTALEWGTLPRVYLEQDEKTRKALLRAYVQVYLKEEVLIEQLIRNLAPFKSFLEVSAQMNGERLNYEKIGRDIGVENRTVQSYFDILEETFLGTRLPAFHVSVRKSQLMQPKFYWFDLGVQRALSGQLDSRLVPQTVAYGNAFETFFVNEVLRLNLDVGLDWRPSYLQTKNGPEIDLILSRGTQHMAVEIKSTAKVDLIEVGRFHALAKDVPGLSHAWFVSRDPKRQEINGVDCAPWQTALSEMLTP